MSYRELRDATEMLRALGYPRLVSIDNFRLPNFPLMAEMLEWTVRKFEPGARMPRQIEAEADRVLFVKSAVLALLQKAHVRLNPKNLYQSDGHAVRELLPVLRMLYDSANEQQRRGRRGGSRGATEADDDGEVLHIGTLRTQVNVKRQELRNAVQLATELPKASASLYELLRDELFAREVRARALGRTLNATQVEAEVRERIQATERRVAEVRERLANIEQDEQELARKIERRKREQDQLQKRLAKLQAFRPPYMDEYERYEAELRERYTEYVSLFRNLHTLQYQLAHAEAAERVRAEEAERAMRAVVERARAESEMGAPAIAGIPLGLAGMAMEDGDGSATQPSKKQVRVFGNMTGMGMSDDDEEEEEGDEGDEDEEEEVKRMIEEEEEEEDEEEGGGMMMRKRGTTEEGEEEDEEEDHSEDNF